MKCPNCGKELYDANIRFCNNCGAKLTVAQQPQAPAQSEQNISKSSDRNTEKTVKRTYNDEPEFDLSETAQRIKNSVKHGVDNIKEAYNTGTKYTVPNSILNGSLVPCDGEKPVRQYHFLRMALPIIGYKADSSIQVTNKRLLYHSIGSTIFGGKEESYSEISIDDVAGISIERSTSINIPILLVFIVVNVLLLGVGVLFTLIGLMGSLSGLNLPIIPVILGGASLVGTFTLFKKKYYSFSHIVTNLGAMIAISGFISAAAGGFSSGLSSLLGYSSNHSGTISYVLLCIIIICLGVMNWVTLFMSLFKKNISVVVTSKTGATNAIDCSSNKSLIFGVDNLKPFIYMFETEEIAVMEAELGAMISDIQKMGDYGIEKWSK